MPRSVTITTLLDAAALSCGTLTALPVPAPAEVNRRVAGLAMLLAPVTVFPLGIFAAAAASLADWVGLGSLAVSVIAFATLAALTAGLHLDGLADTADGFGCTGGRDAALAVMKRGDVGPMGAVTLLLSLVLQIALFAGIWAQSRHSAAIFLLVAVPLSRLPIAVACHRIPAARPAGLGAMVAGAVPTRGLLVPLMLGLATLLLARVLGLQAAPVLIGILVAALGVVALLRRAGRRFGGITGDVLGGTVEVAMTGLLLGFAAST